MTPETVPQTRWYATPPNVPVGCEPVIDTPVILDCWLESAISAGRFVPGDAARGIESKNGTATSAAHRMMLAKRIRFQRGMGIDRPSGPLLLRSIMPIRKSVYTNLRPLEHGGGTTSRHLF